MKNKWLLIPILTMTLPLTGCDTKDYKFDDPKAIIRNLSSKRGAVLNYPYESKASLSGANYIYDIENNVVNGLKKATFEKGKPNTPNPDKYIEFTLHS